MWIPTLMGGYMTRSLGRDFTCTKRFRLLLQHQCEDTSIRSVTTPVSTRKPLVRYGTHEISAENLGTCACQVKRLYCENQQNRFNGSVSTLQRETKEESARSRFQTYRLPTDARRRTSNESSAPSKAQRGRKRGCKLGKRHDVKRVVR